MLENLDRLKTLGELTTLPRPSSGLGKGIPFPFPTKGDKGKGRQKCEGKGREGRGPPDLSDRGAPLELRPLHLLETKIRLPIFHQSDEEKCWQKRNVIGGKGKEVP